MALADVEFRFLSHGLVLRTDAPSVAEHCRRLFAPFLGPAGDGATLLEIRSTNGAWIVRDPVLEAEVEDDSWLCGIAVARILEDAGNTVRDHDLFHAAAVARGDRGLILCAESGTGKSVLTLALLQAGWSFLSDEVAAVEHATGNLVPFPKNLELLPDAFALVGLPRPRGPFPRGKALVDPSTLFPGSRARPCRATAVVFLRGSDGADSDGPGSGSTIRLLLHRKPEDLLDAVGRLKGVVSVRWAGERHGLPVLEVDRDPRTFAAWTLEEVLGRHGALVVDVSTELHAAPDYTSEPELAPMRSTEGVARLLTCFRGHRRFADLLEGRTDGFPGLFLSMLERYAGVRFFRLGAGRLPAMVRLVDDLP